MKQHRDFEFFMAAAGRHEDYFPRGLPLEMQVLKGHLLIERAVREVLGLFMRNPDALESSKSSKLNFYQALTVLSALTERTDHTKALWTSIQKLNRVRNRLAHELEDEQLIKDIDDLVDSIDAIEPGFLTDMRTYFDDGRSDFELATMCIVKALTKVADTAA